MVSNTFPIIKAILNKDVRKNIFHIHNRFKESEEYKPINVIRCGLNVLKNDRLVIHNGDIIVNSFLPPVNSVAFKSIVDAVPGEKSEFFHNHTTGKRLAPISTYIAVTGRCMYNCWHCSAKRFIKEKDDKSKELTTEELKLIIKSLQDLGVGIIGLTGGEPLLRKDIEELISTIDNRSTSILFTNGYSLSLEKAKSLKEAGLFGVGISIDSLYKENHDKKRGYNGAYENSINAIKNSKEAGLYTMAQTVCTKEMLETKEIYNLAKYLKELGVNELRILEPIPCGSLLVKKDEIYTVEEKKKLINLHIELNKGKAYPKTSVFPYLESKDQYGCGAGVQHSYIDNEGNFTPCDFVEESFGNVLNENIRDIWNKMHGKLDHARNYCYAKKCDKCIENDLPRYYKLLKGQ
ncbi:radical SAM protein [Clostridium sp. AL.422]|uniref:radical SAM/SPASM domain-containing protein n=1 Tax=Clostridium TaxID=1485 RepID=UPI00293DB965|nr:MULTISPECIES: radical SAM protein [unclassified Clostridium]MDV4151739.1 radical SAM protein [Clostridium sp. AL.422]